MAINFPLDPQQERAVYFDGNAMISACPGSGKTRVLSCRAAHILSDPKTRLVAVTFTRDSAAELKRRILELCDRSPSGRLYTGTFHSCALGQFKRTKRPVRVLGGGEQITVYRRSWEKTPEAQILTLEEAIQGVDAIKSSMDPAPGPDSPLGAFYRAYQDTLAAMGVFDFADLLIQSVLSMRAGDLPPLPVTHMLVDEAQDMDAVQYAWIECHAKNGAQVTIVGDDDQSIYGFRSAMGYDGMMRFKRQFQANHISLSTNYRSCSEIITVATSLVSNNKARVEKGIRPHRDVPGKVEIVKSMDRFDEAETLYRTVLPTEPGDWAVLGRTNRILDVVEMVLCTKQIPCTRIGGKNFWEGQEPAVFLGLLKSLVKGDGVGDLLALHWAGVPKALLDSVQNGANDWEHIRHNIADLPDDVMDKAGKKLISGFLERRRRWVTSLATGRVKLVISGVSDWCQSLDKNSKKNQVFQWCEEALNRLSGTLDSRIYTLTQQGKKKGEGSEGVKLMTIHNSKGLEFPNVWVIGAEEGLLPHLESTIEEERRLAYVAMTRAMDRLVLSYSVQDTTPSRFIGEAGFRAL